MEASALMSVAGFRGVDLAVGLAVSDELYKMEPRIWKRKVEKDRKTFS